MDQRAFAKHLNGQLGRSYDKARISRWESVLNAFRRWSPNSSPLKCPPRR